MGVLKLGESCENVVYFRVGEQGKKGS